MYILLEENGTEARVESTNTLALQDLAETADKTAGESGIGDETDTGSLKRAESNIGEELGGGRRSEVDGGAVVGSGLVAELVDGLLLEELVTTELEGTLEEVTGEGRADTSPDGAEALLANDLPEATDQAAVVLDGVKLDGGLDAAEITRSASEARYRGGEKSASAAARRGGGMAVAG